MVKEIRIPIYNARVTFVYMDDISVEMRKYCDDVSDNELAMTVWWADKHDYVIGIRKDAFSITTLVHESCHLTHRILENAGVPNSSLEDEAEAYLVGYIADTLYKLVQDESNG